MSKEEREYQGYRGAGIRLKEEMAPELKEYSYHDHLGPPERSIFALKGAQMFDKAHVVMLYESSIIPKDPAVQILKALREIDEMGVVKTRLDAGGGIHSGEKYVTQKLGPDLGGHIHTGRSSGDLSSVSRRIHLRDQTLNIMRELCNARENALELAKAHLETTMPGYTHLQHAQPFTLAHYLCGKSYQLARDFERLQHSYEHINMSPAGSAIFTGSDFPVNRERTRELLGFDTIIKNTMDAIQHHDMEMEIAHVLSILNMSIAKIAEDLLIWSTSEFGMIRLADRWCGTSSIMPQKKNAYALEHMKGVASAVAARSLGLIISEKTSTGTAVLDRDLAEYDLLRSFDDTIGSIKMLSGVISTLETDKEVMKRLAGEYWAQATDLAGEIVRNRDIPWRTAHQITGTLVRKAYEKGLKPEQVTSAMIDDASLEATGKSLGLREDIVRNAMDPFECVKRRQVQGGTAPQRVKEQIEECYQILRTDEKTISNLYAKLEEASIKLEDTIDKIIS